MLRCVKPTYRSSTSIRYVEAFEVLVLGQSKEVSGLYLDWTLRRRRIECASFTLGSNEFSGWGFLRRTFEIPIYGGLGIWEQRQVAGYKAGGTIAAYRSMLVQLNLSHFIRQVHTL